MLTGICIQLHTGWFLSDPGVPGVRSMGPVVSHSVRGIVADLTDVTLVDEDTKSMPTDNANRAIQVNQAMHVTFWCANLLVMQVVPSGGQIYK